MNKTILSSLLMLLIASPFFFSNAQDQSTVPIVLISIDGLKPDYVIDADKHGLKIPNLRRILAEGAHASGVTGVLPTVTYPSHATMVTGVSPAAHGIIANSPFDPFSKNMNGWYWYADDLKVPTLWDACARMRLVTSSVDWPVTVSANITYNIVQYWRAENAEDRKLIRALSTPGLFAEAEQALGPYTDGNDYSIAGDVRRAAFNVYLIEKKKPRFHLSYFGSLDEEEHRSGPYSAPAFAVLEQLDGVIGQLRTAAERSGGGKAVICIVSDHGFKLTDKEVNVNSALREAGLIELNEQGRVKSWRALAWYGGGSAGVMIRDRADSDARRIAAEVLNRLAGDSNSGVAKVIERGSGPEPRGFPDAPIVVVLRPGFRLGSKLQGPVTVSVRPGGTHGYAPDVAEMNSSFFIAGPGISARRDLGQIDMRDIAPTLASLLGVSLPSPEGRKLTLR
ncbi:MAG TPA: ectonucleotide pyrophosphatase/phosphodiesterase [Blastocatellia bacterium]|nr:ectonucleotide pyrophosphatase/phosphodiesterase [Blastocatellia bacterium]